MSLETVRCPECHQEFEVEPTDSAIGFQCPNPECGQLSALAALRNPDLRNSSWEIAEHLSLSAAANLHRCTLAYLFPDKNLISNASGTLLSIGDRVLLCTTGHSIQSNCNTMGLVPKSLRSSTEPGKWILNTAIHDYLDVGFIEIDPAGVSDLDAEPIELDRIHDAETGNCHFKTWLIGYPYTYRIPLKAGHIEKGISALSYTCELIEPSRWLNIPFSLHAGRDVVMYYERKDIVDWERTPKLPKGTPDPLGMSGGGYWHSSASLPGNSIWTAQKLCLVAIQSAWLPEKSYLRGVQIIHLLDLIAVRFPEYRDELEQRFPRLKSL